MTPPCIGISISQNLVVQEDVRRLSERKLALFRISGRRKLPHVGFVAWDAMPRDVVGEWLSSLANGRQILSQATCLPVKSSS